MSIFQCIRCPRALHIRCMDKEKVVKISKKLFICDVHFKNKKELKKVAEKVNPVQASQINVNGNEEGKKSKKKKEKTEKKKKEKLAALMESEE